mgnify:CR=1 FL=1
MNLNYFIIAGEASGDIHASHLMREMKLLNPNAMFSGIGGELMKKEGLSSLVNIDKMAIMGFWEVLKNFRFLKSVEDSVLSYIKKNQIHAIILVDYPGFNLRIAKKIKNINPKIPIFYYISPQIWAWKESRLDTIKKYIDKMIVIFDFEKKWYKKRGVDVDFVGHPFLDTYKNFDKKEALLDLGLSPDKKYLTLFPGSRKQEIENHLPHMLQAIQDSFFDDFEILLGQAITLKNDIQSRFHLNRVTVIKDSPEKALAVADFAWVGSGTSTLESVLLNTPIILVYQTSSFSWYLMQKMVKVKYAGMPNIIMNKQLVPELLQKELTAKNLIAETKRFFNDPSHQAQLLGAYKKIKNTLGDIGASKRAAELIIDEA